MFSLLGTSVVVSLIIHVKVQNLCNILLQWAFHISFLHCFDFHTSFMHCFAFHTPFILCFDFLLSLMLGGAVLLSVLYLVVKSTEL